MSIFLVSYRPLVAYSEGREAISKHSLPPFIDYSCRKEPDFSSAYPSITALCRKGKFAPRLREGDTVVYITIKGNILKLGIRHWRLVAVLKVFHRFMSHRETADWYQRQSIPIPSNCMIPNNPPLPIDMTAPITDFKTDLRKWDLDYWKRAGQYGDFLACKSQFKELYDPPVITDELMRQVFGRIPGTQNPGEITNEEFNALSQECSIDNWKE